MTQLVTEIFRPVGNAGFDRIEAAARRLEDSAPEETLRWAFEEFQSGVTIATGFGPEGVALIDMALRINPLADVFFLDTSFLFPETYELRRQLEARYKIEIRAFQTDITPEMQESSFGAKLWSADPDLCCRLRKLEPLKDALHGREAWITAIRRDQTLERSSAREVEWDHRWRLVKINPLVRWSKQQVWDYIATHDLPYNPLHDRGYSSIGCTHCTQPVLLGGAERAGRWPGRAKRECGLHGPAPPTAFVPLRSSAFSAVEIRTLAAEDAEGRRESVDTQVGPMFTNKENETLDTPDANWSGKQHHRGMVIWLTGLSGAGKTTLAGSLSKELEAAGLLVETLDGDEVRENLSRGLGFSKEDRNTNINRIGFVARLLARNGVVVLGAAISPYRQSRDDVRRRIEADDVRFIEVFVRCPLGTLVERDVKGLYAKALVGEIKHFTGVSDPYEEPIAPDITVDSSVESIEESTARILAHLLDIGAVDAEVMQSEVYAASNGVQCRKW